MKTRMTELLGIKYPIMQGGMQHLGVPELAAAVSEAGGLGTINVTIYPDPEDLRKAIKEVKAKTDKPFAVNISLIPSLHPGQELFDQVKVILEEGVTAVETAGASPQELADVLNAHKDQVKWIHKAACVKHAKKAESMGADLITMAGFEVAGHPHTDGVGTMVLANRTAREVKVPVLAAGGIADGRGLLAALSLGCEGVVMGTRFVASKECWISENHKNWIVEEWLLDRAQKHGFELLPENFQIVERDWHIFRKGKEQGKNKVSIKGVTYEGILKVCDEEKFKELLVAGIGRGKAYGMGLLTIVHI